MHSEPGLCMAYKKGFADLKKSLRRKQIERAESGNATMLIWLGKQLLGQRDVPDPVQVEVDEDWVYRTKLSDGSYFVVPAGTDPIDAYHEAIRSKRSKGSE